MVSIRQRNCQQRKKKLKSVVREKVAVIEGPKSKTQTVKASIVKKVNEKSKHFGEKGKFADRHGQEEKKNKEVTEKVICEAEKKSITATNS